MGERDARIHGQAKEMEENLVGGVGDSGSLQPGTGFRSGATVYSSETRPANEAEAVEKEAAGANLCARRCRRYRELQGTGGCASNGKADRAYSRNRICHRRPGLRKRKPRRI